MYDRSIQDLESHGSFLTNAGPIGRTISKSLSFARRRPARDAAERGQLHEGPSSDDLNAAYTMPGAAYDASERINSLARRSCDRLTLCCRYGSQYSSSGVPHELQNYDHDRLGQGYLHITPSCAGQQHAGHLQRAVISESQCTSKVKCLYLCRDSPTEISVQIVAYDEEMRRKYAEHLKAVERYAA